ncbi:MAG: class I SAM-dependent methyltransferase [Rhodocyclaceae bacterium]|nr:class I SAM-dependent methyltransferase [Rhodocyclaceae bacterium]
MTQKAHRTSWYERNVLPYVIDAGCGMKPFHQQRQKVVPHAAGHVLEIGIGTGLNLEHYDKARVNKVIGLDPGTEMHPMAQKRMKKAGLPVELVGLSAETIPFDEATFDSVVVTYSLCTIPDPVAALKEMRRVLKREGKLLFCEHGLSPDHSARRWQDRLTPLWIKLFGGCHLNRDIPALLGAAGFRCDDLQTMYLPGPRPITYNYWGTAVAD